MSWWEPHSFSETQLSAALQSSLVEQAAAAEGPAGGSRRRWRDLYFL